MRAEAEARMATEEEEMLYVGSEAHESETRDEEMEGVGSKNPPLFVLSKAAASAVLHLVGQHKNPSSSTQEQDHNEEMDDAPCCWTTDNDDDIGMGPANG